MTGVTSDIIKRVWEHKNDFVEGFTKRYGVHQLVWYELHGTMESAIVREKQLKEWKRKWKLEMIERTKSELAGFVRYDSLSGFQPAPHHDTGIVIRER